MLNKQYLFKTTIPWFLFGVLLVVSSKYLQDCSELQGCAFANIDCAKISNFPFVKLIGKVVEAVGLALSMSALASWVFDTNDMISRLTMILRKIVQDGSYVGTLKSEEQKKLITNIIMSRKDSEPHVNMDRYYESYIDKLLDINTLGVRTNQEASAFASFNTKKGKLQLVVETTYRLYPPAHSETTEQTITLKIDDKDDVGEMTKLMITTPSGDYLIKTVPAPVETKDATGKVIAREYEQKFDMGKHDFVYVALTTITYGYDHWMPICYRTGKPTDGMTYKIRCEPSYIIKSVETFTHTGSIFTTVSDEPNMLHLSTSQWLREGCAITCIISKT